MKDLYLSGYKFESMVDGSGVRTVLFFSGCKHNCPGCHSPETHDFNNGQEVTNELIEFLNTEMKKRPFLSGITLSGGDPIYNAEAVYRLLRFLYIPNNNIWLYTGFTYDELMKLKDKYAPKLLNMCNYIVTDPFIESERDITSSCKFRGSTNQRIFYNNHGIWEECKE